MDCWISSFRSIFGRAVRKSSDFRRYVLVFFIGWFVQIWSSWHAQIYAKKNAKVTLQTLFKVIILCSLENACLRQTKIFLLPLLWFAKIIKWLNWCKLWGKKSWVFYDRAVLHAQKICPFGFWVVFVRAGQRLDLLKIQEKPFSQFQGAVGWRCYVSRLRKNVMNAFLWAVLRSVLWGSLVRQLSKPHKQLSLLSLWYQ